MTESNDTASSGARQTGSDTRLLDAFREMYAEVTQRARALQGPEPPDAEAVKHRLLGVLARQTADAREQLADHEVAELYEAQYVMVAMADEVMLRRPWPGREAWAAEPLEAERPFGSHVAGERIFQKLDAILAGRATVSVALLDVYITALALGFRGRYRYDPTSPEPQRYRREIVRHLHRLEPRAAAPRTEVCPDAPPRGAGREPRRELTSLREGLLPLVAILLSMTVLGHALWYYRTLGLRVELDRIEEVKGELERPLPAHEPATKLNLASGAER